MFFVTAHVINFVNFDVWHFCKPFISRSQLTRCFDQYLGSEISLSISMWLVLLLTGCSGSIEVRRSFSYSRFWLCKTCGWIEKKKRKKEKKKKTTEKSGKYSAIAQIGWWHVKVTPCICTLDLVKHDVSSKSERVKKLWQKKVRVVYWTKKLARFPKFSKSWIKLWTSHFLWSNPCLCEKLFVISH